MPNDFISALFNPILVLPIFGFKAGQRVWSFVPCIVLGADELRIAFVFAGCPLLSLAMKLFSISRSHFCVFCKVKTIVDWRIFVGRNYFAISSTEMSDIPHSLSALITISRNATSPFGRTPSYFVSSRP